MADSFTEADHAYAWGFAWGLGFARPEGWNEADRVHASRVLSIVQDGPGPDLLAGDSAGRNLLSTRAAEQALARVGDQELAWEVARGLFDSAGLLQLGEDGPALTLTQLGPEPRTFFAQATGWFAEGSTEMSGVAALDVLGRLFGRPDILARPSHRQTYEDACVRVSHLNEATTLLGSLAVQRLRSDAVLPSKERISDSGYDLTLIYEKKKMGVVTMYGTGLVLQPPSGWYLDVVPRSSIVKRGYILANNVGIIDRSYRGEIFVPLIKIDPNVPDLDLPARVAQLIPRPIVHFPVREEDSLSATERGAGGFGSTGA
jgi:deoxyuridine 5'-triphosphate nucleotidohydrolase